MSLDTGLVIRKTSNGWSIFEINLSTKNLTLIKKLGKMKKESVLNKIKNLNKKVYKFSGQEYEGIWFEYNVKDKKKTINAIDKIKNKTKKEMDDILNKISVKHKMAYILKNKKAVAVEMFEWAEWLEKSYETKERIVKQETLSNGYFVSTVFLGLNHNWTEEGDPLIFETMVFPNKGNMLEKDVQRYSTWQQAEEGHAEMVKKWNKKFTLYKLLNFIRRK